MPEHLLILYCSDTLDKTKVTGISQVDNLQDGVNNLVGGQVGKDGLLAPVGNMASKEGVNRMERGGKDESGTYGGRESSLNVFSCVGLLFSIPTSPKTHFGASTQARIVFCSPYSHANTMY